MADAAAPARPAAALTRQARRAAAWRAGLADRIAAVAAAWALRPGAVLADRPATRVLGVLLPDGAQAVLKLAPPGQALEAEAAALAAMGRRGAAALLRADLARGALLLVRACPGTPLLDLARRDDDAATRIAARLIATLPAPVPPHGLFAEAAGWGRALAAPGLPRRAADRAAGLLRELATGAPPPRLLHGDLHHGNILAHHEGWLAVDPKGLLGEPAAEAACLLRNPAEPALLARAPRRAAIVAEVAGLPRERVLAWGYAGAVIAAAWALEDAADPAPWLAAAAALAPHLR